MPEWLDSALDGAKASRRTADADKIGVHLRVKSWSVDVSSESVLRAGRPLARPVLEFFLIALRHVCSVLRLGVYIGSSALGARVGSGLEVRQC